MAKKQIKTWMITWATHNTRISERMIEFGVQLGEPVILNGKDEIEITGYIANIVQQHKQGVVTPCINILAYNICRDHIHIILQCAESERNGIVQKLKAVSARKYNIKHGMTVPTSKGSGPLVHANAGTGIPKKGIEQNHLRGQKYNYSEIKDEKYLYNAMEYIKTNREHHSLPANKGLQALVHTVVRKDYIFDKIQYKEV